jgi:lactoylglutathione lyase
MSIERVGSVSVFVADQARARDFYTRVLGMELRADAPLFPGSEARWIAVAPPGAETEIVLYLPDENWEHYRGTVGQSHALTLAVPDMAATAQELRARGVTFVEEPQEQPWGTFAIIEDSEGNKLILSEPAEQEPPTVKELLRRIDRSRRALEQTVAGLSEAQLTARGPSGWAVKDHLSHLATWELGIVELLHKRSRFEAMGVQDAMNNGQTEDEINELIFRRRANRSVGDVLTYFADVHEQMLEVLRSMEDEDLMRPYSSFLPEGAAGSDRPVIGWIVGNTYAHYDEHRRYIETLIEALDMG